MEISSQIEKAVQQVRRYDLFLDVDFAGLKFTGKVTVELDTTGDVGLDAVGLHVSSVKQGSRTVPFKQTSKSVEIQTGKFSGPLDVEFSGRVSDNFTGLYKASYGDGYILTTHLESVQARKLFPCVDHPAFKAVFRLVVKTGPDLKVISNTPIESEEIRQNRKIVAFKETPKMSTYLLYLGVGKFVEDQSRHGKTLLYSAHARPKGTIKTEFSFEAAQKVLDYYESYFGIPYQLPKLHQVAVPEFAYGAMENWGAITYREILIHVDKDTSVKAKKAVANVIAHEIAHMWFGDLVTMKWWDDIWLNESFATFMGHRAVDSGYPQWSIWQDFVRMRTANAYGRDGLRSTHSIQTHVVDPVEIEELFDEISYDKGASTLRMIEAYIGADNFRKGVSNYLDKFRYSNAEGRDLWTHLQEASGTDVNRIMEAWISKPGFPIITATMSGNKLQLAQERFLMAGGIEKQIWPVPITMSIDGKRRNVLFDREKTEVDVGTPKMLKLNVDQTGFYIVHYQGVKLNELVWKSKLSPLDKWGLLSDAKALLLEGRMPFKEYLALLERFRDEQEYLPLFEISDQLELLHVLAPAKVRDVARRFNIAILKTLESRNDENSLMLKGYAAGRLAMLDDAFAKEQSAKINSLTSVEPDMKRVAVMGYARTTNDYDGLVERFRKSTTDEDRLRFLEGLTSFRKPELVAKALEFSLSGQVKKQDVRNMLSFAISNADARGVVWDWFKTNIEKLDRMYEGTAQLSVNMRSFISISGVGKLNEAEALFRRYPVPAADATLEKMRIYDRLSRAIIA